MASCSRCGALTQSGTEACAYCGSSVVDSEQTGSPWAHPPGALPPASPPPPPFAAAPPSTFAGFLPNIEASAAPPPLPGLEVPKALRDFSRELEEWAKRNERDARNDTLRYWALKVPAILSTAASALLVLASQKYLVAGLSGLASACVVIDAINPGGQLRNAHLKAFHELRDLQHQVMNSWRIGHLKGKGHNLLAAEILTSAEKTRDRIAKELRTAETAFATSTKARR